MKKKFEKIFKQKNLEKILKQIILEKIFKQIFFDQSEVLLHSWTNSRSAYKLLARKMQVMVSPNSDWSRTEHQSCAHGWMHSDVSFHFDTRGDGCLQRWVQKLPAQSTDYRQPWLAGHNITSDIRSEIVSHVKIIKMYASPRRYPPLGVGIF